MPSVSTEKSYNKKWTFHPLKSNKNNNDDDDLEVAHIQKGSSSTWYLVELEFGNEVKTGAPREKPPHFIGHVISAFVHEFTKRSGVTYSAKDGLAPKHEEHDCNSTNAKKISYETGHRKDITHSTTNRHLFSLAQARSLGSRVHWGTWPRVVGKTEVLLL